MSNQPRVAKVLAALLVSMTAGAVVLMAMNGNPPSAGPFCLSSYYRLDPVEEALYCEAAESPNRWNCIEVFYSGTKSGNIEQLASLSGLAEPQQLDCHFVICNGLGGDDGQILATRKWDKQWSVIPSRNWYGTTKTIRICVVAEGQATGTTNSQVRRVEALIERLSRKFEVLPDSVYYPSNWR